MSMFHPERVARLIENITPKNLSYPEGVGRLIKNYVTYSSLKSTSYFSNISLYSSKDDLFSWKLS